MIPKQAVILCAGLGTRLRPYTDLIPKPMVPVAGKPLLEHTVMSLKAQGCTDFIINLHYLHEKITTHFGDGSRFGVRMRYSDETEALMNTGGALKKMEPMLDDTFLFMYGDELHRFDFAPVADFHAKSGAVATIVLGRGADPQDGDIARFDAGTKRIVEWHVRPHGITSLESDLFFNNGLYVLSKKITDYVTPDATEGFDRDVLPRAMAAGAPLFGWPTGDGIFDIGTPSHYLAGKEWYEKGK